MTEINYKTSVQKKALFALLSSGTLSNFSTSLLLTDKHASWIISGFTQRSRILVKFGKIYIKKTDPTNKLQIEQLE